MLTPLTIVIMLIVAYSFWQEGILTAFTMIVNVLIAGLIAFNFWEPLANEAEPLFKGTFLQGYEDALVLVMLFALTLGGMRLVTNNLAPTQLDLHPAIGQGGAIAMGLVTGYLVSGFLVCVLQTLPWYENFMFFDAAVDENSASHATRQYFPPDRVWLALMHRAGRVTFGTSDQPDRSTFDPDGSFELRYSRYRRYTDTRDPLVHRGELDPRTANEP